MSKTVVPLGSRLRLTVLGTLAWAWLLFGSVPVHAELPKSAHRYVLDAALDPDAHRVSGHVRIHFTNTSEEPLTSLLFHLYLNAFRDRESVFMQESSGSMRGQRFGSKGSLTLETLTVGGKDQLANARRELVPKDFTQLEVPLETPLLPGQTAVIESRFVAELPELFARSGYAGDFFCVAQWFPKLAKLEPSGRFESFPYHALGEFYADFADYELTVTAPQDYSIYANGTIIREARERGSITRVFSMKHVHDVVWVASPSMLFHRERIDGVDVRFVYPPGYELAMREHAQTVRAGLPHFSALFGRYPYPSLTVVIPPRKAKGGAGMEYPGLFLTDGAWFAVPSAPGISGAFVTAHELAHQWFPGIVASNELRYPVLDEGLAQWAALDLLRAQFGERGALGWFSPVSRFEAERLLAKASGATTAPGRAAYAYTPSEYGASVYARAAVVLETVRRVYGKKRFEDALRAYATEQRFRHPTPSDLAAAFDSVYGEGFSARILTPLLFEGKTSAVRIVRARTTHHEGVSRTEVQARRSGEVALPTWLSAFDRDGRELTRVQWPQDVETLRATLETRTPVARVAVDADRALLVDEQVSDQVVSFEGEARRSWISFALFALQSLLSWMGP